MQIAENRRAVDPANDQRPADDQRQPEAGDRHPQAEDHEHAAEHFGEMQPPLDALRKRCRNTRMQERLQACEKGHAADRKTKKEERPVDARVGCRHEKQAEVEIGESGPTRRKAGSIAALPARPGVLSTFVTTPAHDPMRRRKLPWATR